MNTADSTYETGAELDARQQQILRLVVQNCIATAGPVGSRTLTRVSKIGLSPSTVRNTMGDLEALGYLCHPHTSAGRQPTQRGYRAFVDQLMDSPELLPNERGLIRMQLEQWLRDEERLFRECSRLLGRMSNLLGVVLSPRMSTGVLERLDVVRLSSTDVMLVIRVQSRLVKTIVFETQLDATQAERDRIVSILNERLVGLTLDEIRDTYASRTRDLDDDPTGIVQLILNESTQVFSDEAERRLTHAGTRGLLEQPEFKGHTEVGALIALIEDRGYVVDLFEKVPDAQPGRASVCIGTELFGETVNTYSIVTARYRFGATSGTVGLLGPMRMNYRRAIALVEATARNLNRRLNPSTS